jgi:hypothetical protein
MMSSWVWESHPRRAGETLRHLGGRGGQVSTTTPEQGRVSTVIDNEDKRLFGFQGGMKALT